MERTVVVKAVGSAITPSFGEDSGQAWRCGPREGRAAPPGRSARLRPHDGARFLRTRPSAAAQTKAGARPPPRYASPAPGAAEAAGAPGGRGRPCA